MRIVISGYYGFANAGDDAILLASIPLIREIHPDARIFVVTYPGADLDAVYRSTGLTAIDGSDIAHVSQIIASADLVLIGGGGLIQDYLPSDHDRLAQSGHNNLTFWLSLAVIARAHDVPVSTWMVGIGPLTTERGREDAGLLLRSMSVVSVRDEEPAGIAEALGVDPDRIVIGADPVFTFDPQRAQREGDQPVVGVIVRNWDGISVWLPPIVEALDRLVSERSARIRFVPFQSGRGGIESDDLVAMRLAARMKSVDTRSVEGVGAEPNEIAQLIAGCDAVLGMRLHSVILAAAAGVPAVGLAYDPKVTRVMNRIGRAGFVHDLESPHADWLFDRLSVSLDEGFDSRTIDEITASLKRAASTVLLSEAEPPELPETLFPILVASLASAATANGELERRLAAADRELTERGNYLNERVAELHSVRNEFQAFRDARAVKLAQLAWDGRRAATEAVSAIRQRFTNPKLQLKVQGGLSIRNIVTANPGSAGFVVFAPSIHWDVELFQRPQQMALAFARQGYTVMYQVDEQYRNGLSGYRQVGERIYEGYLEPDRYDELDQIPDPLFLSYVYNYAWGRNLTNAHAVYEHIDDLEVFEQVYGRHDLDRWHTEALHNADVVVGSAVDLMADLTPVRPDALLVPNGVDVGHFRAEDRPVPDDISELVAAGTPIIGYYGALAEWFDYGLLRRLAERLDDHAFVLIGPDYDGTLPRSDVANLPNVHWLGPKPYASLPAYLDRFAVATIPFVVNEVTHAVSPLKLFEYMAGGKPVITPPLRECARYREVFLADGVDEWAEMIELAVEFGADDSFRRRMIAAAEQNTWDARVRTILDAVEMTDDK